jgi:hypothetical protein
MGKTHFRSDVIEEGSRTASFSTFSGGKMSLGGGAGSYYKLGTLYIITGNPTAFTKAGINAAATSAAGVALSAIPRGSLFLNASSNLNATQAAYIKINVSTWAAITTASQV